MIDTAKLPKRPRTMPTQRSEAVIRDGSQPWDAVQRLFAELDAERSIADELAAALRALTDEVEQTARNSYHVAGGARELFDPEFEDADHETWLLWKAARAALARWQGTKENK